MNIKITADSTCDLPATLIDAYDIEIIPLYINREGIFYKDGIEITADDIFSHVENGGALCSTAAVNVFDYKQVFTRIKQSYDAIIHFTISSTMSSCYQNACQVAAELPNVYVVDSANLCCGIGMLVLEAAIMARQGLEPTAIVEAIVPLRDKLDASFVLDTLEYLRKGGRCSTIASLGANILHLKPCIEVRGGNMRVGKKYRGSLEKSFTAYVHDRLADAASIDSRRVFIADSGITEDRYTMVRDAVLECIPFAEVYRARAGCTISSHCGPNCMGIFFFHK